MKATARRRDGFTHDVEIEGGHSLVIDEPEAVGGNDLGPSPARTVAAALAACTAITVEMYADRKGWDLGRIEVDAELVQGPKASLESFTVTLRIPEALDADQEQRLLRIAGKCPVHRALSAETKISIDDRIEAG
ncbi:MAG TPA: OsmC family protein [Solirubrobacterales bacterium]|nr:OsmC family protein [Solirubrobacterales bacterium]